MLWFKRGSDSGGICVACAMSGRLLWLSVRCHKQRKQWVNCRKGSSEAKREKIFPCSIIAGGVDKLYMFHVKLFADAVHAKHHKIGWSGAPCVVSVLQPPTFLSPNQHVAAVKVLWRKIVGFVCCRRNVLQLDQGVLGLVWTASYW